MKESKYWEVKFKFKYPKNPGEEVRVTGNTESLGNWNLDIAPKLIYDSKKELWKTKAYLKIPASFNLEYKYLIFKEEIFDKWEDIETNRKVVMPEKEKLVFSDEDNNPETYVKKHYAKNKKKAGDSSKNLKSTSKSNSKSKKLKKVSSARKVSKRKNKLSEINLDEDGGEIEKEIDLNDNNMEKEIEFNLDDSIEKYQELNYDSYSEKEDDYSSKMVPSFNNDDILDDKDDIIMVSTYIPFNPVREKDGSIKFILTNEAIYHTLYRVIETKKNIKWFGNLKYLKKLEEEPEIQ